MDIHNTQWITQIVKTYALTPLSGRIDKGSGKRNRLGNIEIIDNYNLLYSQHITLKI